MVLRGVDNYNMISLKKRWVASDGWRGREVPVNAVAGAADTGSWDDSPCPSNVATAELNEVKVHLKKAGIRYRTTWGTTSNLFCIHRYVVVAEEDVPQASQLVAEFVRQQRERLYLLYAL